MTELKELQETMRVEWYQTGLKTFFWAGAINAIFFAFGVVAMMRCQETVDEADRIRKTSIMQMEANLRMQGELNQQIDRAVSKIRVLELLIRRQEEGSK